MVGDESEALREIVVRYARAVDRRDFSVFEEIFSSDAMLAGYRGDPETSDPLFRYEGRNAIATGLRAIERYDKTFHMLGASDFEIAGEEATGETYCMAHHIYSKDGATWDRTMAIRYQDRFSRHGGDWRLSSRSLWIDFEKDSPLGDEGWA